MTIIKGICASFIVIVKGILLILEMIIKLPCWLIVVIVSHIRLERDEEENVTVDDRKK